MITTFSRYMLLPGLFTVVFSNYTHIAELDSATHFLRQAEGDEVPFCHDKFAFGLALNAIPFDKE